MESSYKVLVTRALQHDEDALRELYEASYRKAYTTVKMIIKQQEDIDDILQDAYLSAFTHLETLQDADKFPAWICSIASNRCKDFLKKKKPQLFTDLQSPDGEDVDFEDDRMDFQPDAQMDMKATKEIFDGIFNALPEDQRICVLLFYRDEFSVKEIAAALEVPEATVKSRLQYARKKIKAAVEDEEKRGNKLYAATPLLAWVLKGELENVSIPAFPLTASTATANTSAAKTVAAVKPTLMGAKTVAEAAKTGLITKIIAVSAAVVVLAGGTLGIRAAIQNRADQPAPVQSETTPTDAVEVVQPEKDPWEMQCLRSTLKTVNGTSTLQIDYQGTLYNRPLYAAQSANGIYTNDVEEPLVDDCNSDFWIAEGHLIYLAMHEPQKWDSTTEVVCLDLLTGQKKWTGIMASSLLLVTDNYLVAGTSVVPLANLFAGNMANEAAFAVASDRTVISICGNNETFYVLTIPRNTAYGESYDCLIESYDITGVEKASHTVPVAGNGYPRLFGTGLCVDDESGYALFLYDLETGELTQTIDIDLRSEIQAAFCADAGLSPDTKVEVFRWYISQLDETGIYITYEITDIKNEPYNEVTYRFEPGTQSNCRVDEQLYRGEGRGYAE